MIKIICVCGARPNFMKIAPVMRAFEAAGNFETLLVHTGQHYDENMSRLFFDDLNIPRPDVNLEVGSGTHAAQTARTHGVITLHRPSNVDDMDKFEQIATAFEQIQKETKLVFPIHPRTRDAITQCNDLTTKQYSNILFIKPVSYLDMLMLEKNAKKILTDSGGIQKEAYFLRVPCITLRSETEWVETLEDGWNILAGCNKKKIIKFIKSFSPKHPQHKHFGDGKTAKRIVKILINKI